MTMEVKMNEPLQVEFDWKLQTYLICIFIQSVVSLDYGNYKKANKGKGILRKA